MPLFLFSFVFPLGLALHPLGLLPYPGSQLWSSAVVVDANGPGSLELPTTSLTVWWGLGWSGLRGEGFTSSARSGKEMLNSGGQPPSPTPRSAALFPSYPSQSSRSSCSLWLAQVGLDWSRVFLNSFLSFVSFAYSSIFLSCPAPPSFPDRSLVVCIGLGRVAWLAQIMWGGVSAPLSL